MKKIILSMRVMFVFSSSLLQIYISQIEKFTKHKLMSKKSKQLMFIEFEISISNKLVWRNIVFFTAVSQPVTRNTRQIINCKIPFRFTNPFQPQKPFNQFSIYKSIVFDLQFDSNCFQLQFYFFRFTSQ